MTRRLDEVQIAEQEQIVVSVREVVALLDQDRYFNLAGASAYTSISKSTLRHRDDLPRYKVGKKILLFKKSELDKWLEQFREGGSGDLDEVVDGVLADVIGD